ncbi:MAG TPA: hypothetical protein VKV15_23030 [Bryobacteraceae bacterium]|nr:hypothetical protein [Bryobacteraceae bacterium]
MTFTDGDTLAGDFQEQFYLAATPSADFMQILTVTGGTGALRFYNATLTGGGFLNLATSAFSTSGGGTLNRTPEPGSITLLLIALVGFVACRGLYRARGVVD